MNVFMSISLFGMQILDTGVNRTIKQVTHPPSSISAGNSVSAGANPL